MQASTEREVWQPAALRFQRLAGCPSAPCETPWFYVAHDLPDAVVSADKDDIQREAHAEGVDQIAPRQQHECAVRKRVSAKQAACAFPDVSGPNALPCVLIATDRKYHKTYL